MSIKLALMALPAGAENSRRAGSAFLPIPRCLASSTGLAAAMEGQTSSMWAPSTRLLPASRW
ncbi:hypothetical protein D3C85_1596390 [compost metagenome]